MRTLDAAIVSALAAVAVIATPPVALRAQAPALEHSFGGTCEAPEGKGPLRLQLWHHDYGRESATIVADVVAKPDGSYRFDRVPWLAGHDWGFQFFVLHAQRGDHAALVYLRGDEAARRDVRIALKPAHTVRGRTIDANGHPVAGADVAVRRHGDAYFAEALPAWRTRSDDRGEFTIRGVPPGKLEVQCVGSKHALARLFGEAADAFDFVLQPGAVVTGRVVREDGKPVVRGRVCAQGQKTSAWATTRTDDEGRYRLVGLVDDRFNVWLDADDLTCAALDGQAVELGGEVAAPDLVAVPGGFFVGRVVDADTGEGVQPGASADVAIYGPSRPRSGAACDVGPIAADGTFRLRVAPGDNYIYLRADPCFATVGSESFTLPVEAGGETKVEFKVKKAKAKAK